MKKPPMYAGEFTWHCGIMKMKLTKKPSVIKILYYDWFLDMKWKDFKESE